MSQTQTEIYKNAFSRAPVSNEAESLTWLRDIRQKAYRRFQTLGFPTRRMEGWRYIDLELIVGASFVPDGQRSVDAASLKRFERFFFCRLEQNRIAFVNGVYAKELSSGVGLPDGVILENLAAAVCSRRELLEPYLAAHIEKESNAFHLINTFSFRDGVFLYVPENVSITVPIHILFGAAAKEDRPIVFYPRILVVAEKGSSAKIVVDHVAGADDNFFSNFVLESHLGAGASVQYSQVQRYGQKAVQMVSNRFGLREKSALRVMSFKRGGRVTRDEAQVDFIGENASAFLKGLSVLSGESEVYQHAVVNHHVPSCVSRQFYKNILAEKSKSEFNSLVFVEKGAFKSDSEQLNKNLLLSDEARSYSRPQLRIHADDVSCTHGATVGQLRGDELFYLRSRGFSKKMAEFMLTYGFAKEVIQEVEPENVRVELEAWASEELKRVMKL